MIFLPELVDNNLHHKPQLVIVTEFKWESSTDDYENDEDDTNDNDLQHQLTDLINPTGHNYKELSPKKKFIAIHKFLTTFNVISHKVLLLSINNIPKNCSTPQFHHPLPIQNSVHQL